MPDDLTKLKGLQCHNCNMRVYWDFGTDSWRHSYDQGRSCTPLVEWTDDQVAHPRIRS